MLDLAAAVLPTLEDFNIVVHRNGSSGEMERVELLVLQSLIVNKYDS
jgi:hypothetical protein